MCGVFGVVVGIGYVPVLTCDQVERAAELLAHRGPDGSGVYAQRNCIMAHRRLTIVDEAGPQPRLTPRGGVLVYNGEVYNTRELGHTNDTSVLAEMLDTEEGSGLQHNLEKVRGMYALGYVTSGGGKLILARDPLGIKPLYYTVVVINGLRHVMFASEILPLAYVRSSATLGQRLEPDMTTVSSYLTTIRTTLGERTLFEGISCVLPGQILTFDLTRDHLPVTRAQMSVELASQAPVDRKDAVELVRGGVEDSVRAHLVGDAPICALLSGGLDSTIITALARREVRELATYSISGPEEENARGDAHFAAVAARALNTRHTHVTLDGDAWRAGMIDLIEQTGLPLSTPNEVAIANITQRLRSDGYKVALSGEGADEFFAGYESALDAAAAFCAHPADAAGHARFAIDNASWVGLEHKHLVMREPQDDNEMFMFYTRHFEECLADEGLTLHGELGACAAHLRLSQRVNLSGLLLRLDSCAMRSGVEGRTPFADIRVARIAASLPMAWHYSPPGVSGLGSGAAMRTKKMLKSSFSGDVPLEIIERPKASFALPFGSWMGPLLAGLPESDAACEVFTPQAIGLVASQPTTAWALGWPMLNISLWLERWWGSGELCVDAFADRSLSKNLSLS